MSGLKKLIHEIHRRSLWQVLGIYAVGSWVVLQVIDVVGSNVGLPDWVFPFAVVLLALGLPVVLATAFVQEGVRAHRPARPFSDDPSGSVQSSEATGEMPTASPPETRLTSKRLFTWRNAILGGGRPRVGVRLDPIWTLIPIDAAKSYAPSGSRTPNLLIKRQVRNSPKCRFFRYE